MNHNTYYKLLSKAAIPFYKAIELHFIVRSQEFLNSIYLSMFSFVFFDDRNRPFFYLCVYGLNLF